MHGLNPRNTSRHGEKTWTAGQNEKKKLWVKGFLPEKSPNVRVLLFGYTAIVAFKTSTAGEAAENLLDRLRHKRKVWLSLDAL